MLGNVTATAGGLILTGDLGGDFLVIDAESGKELLKHPMNASVGGGVMTYGAGGKQYIAVQSGTVSGFFGGTGKARITILALK